MVGIQRAEAIVGTVALAATAMAQRLDGIQGVPGAEALQAGAGGVHVWENGEIRLVQVLLQALVQSHLGEGEGGTHGGEQYPRDKLPSPTSAHHEAASEGKGVS